MPRLLDLSRTLGEAADSGSAEQLQAAAKAAGEALAELQLATQLQAFSLAPSEPEAKLESPPNEIYVDDANRALLGGGGDDVLVLFNTQAKPGGVRRDLIGRLVFADPVSLCWYHDVPQADLGQRMAFADLVQRVLAASP